MNRTTDSATDDVGATASTLGRRAGAALAAYRAGDPQPLAGLVREATPLLWHVVRAQGVERDEAEDVVQGVWLALVRNAATIREPDAVLAWLLVSARRAAWQVVRRRRDAERRTAALPEPEGPRGGDLASTDPPVEAPVLVAERDSALWRSFSALPERCQQILRFVAMADRPDYRAIATVTGLQVTAVGVTRGRCLAKLRTLLDRDEGWVST